MSDLQTTDTAELLRARMGLVRGELNEVMLRLTQEMIDWAPAAGVRTIGGQLVEIAATEMQTISCLTDGRMVSDAEAEQAFGDCHSLANLVEVIASTRRWTLSVLDSYSEAQLAEPVEIRRAWFASSYLPAVPRAEVFRSIAQHEWYHVGQLVTYLWVRGDNPYKW